LDYLELFELFKSPSALKKGDWVLSLLMKMIAHSEQSIQMHALKSIFRYKSKSLTPYAEYLEKLIDPKKSRDCLTQFGLAPGASPYYPAFSFLL
jgi:hypothetical protein